MNRKTLPTALILVLFVIFFTVGVALAHTTVHAGNYEIEVGWTDEPAVIGQRNAVVVNVVDTTDEEQEVDVSKLLVSVSYGGQTKPLTLQPLSEGTKNQYIAPILPLVPGEYTLQLRGQIGDRTDVNLDVQPEEVESTDALAFPSAPATPGQNNGGLKLSDWLAGGALVVALAALGLGFAALRKTR